MQRLLLFEGSKASGALRGAETPAPPSCYNIWGRTLRPSNDGLVSAARDLGSGALALSVGQTTTGRSRQACQDSCSTHNGEPERSWDGSCGRWCNERGGADGPRACVISRKKCIVPAA